MASRLPESLACIKRIAVVIEAWPINSRILTTSAPDAARRVPNVCRKSRFHHSETPVLTTRRIGSGSSDRMTDGSPRPEKSLRQAATLLHLRADYGRRRRWRLWLSPLQAGARFSDQQAAAPGRADR